MILVINCGSSKTPQIIECIKKAGKEAREISINSFSKNDLTHASGIIISGAPILLTEVSYEPYLELLAPITNATVPVLGICFGHQMIGLLHGATISRCKEDRADQVIEQRSPSPLFHKIERQAIFAEDHCECINLPPTFNLTASSKICENEAMQHASKMLFGVQFHPEVSGENGFQLILNFCDLC